MRNALRAVPMCILDGSSSINLEQIKNINGKIYRIEKKRPFIKDDLSTIQTEITEL